MSDEDIHLFRSLLPDALKESFLKLSPRVQFRNPVMFVAYLAAILMTVKTISVAFSGESFWYEFQISLWLWFTVLFANFASALAESRGKAQAATLRNQAEMVAKKLVDGKVKIVGAKELKSGDLILCEAGDFIPADGDVVKGIATVDESAITGESAPVIRESGGDSSAVTAGTKVLSEEITISVTSEPGSTFLDRMIALIEGASRQKTPNEIALSIVLSALTIIFLLVVISVKLYSDYYEKSVEKSLNPITLTALVALLVCLIPTTISALLNAIGIAGMDRLVRRNVIAKSGRAIEAAGDIDLLVLDKTGTITLGNRMATEFIPGDGITEKELAEISQLASLSDETPEGRSIVVLAKEKFDLRVPIPEEKITKFIPFSSYTRMSGIDILDEAGRVVRSIRKGTIDAIKKFIERQGGNFSPELLDKMERISREGGTPIAVADNGRVIGGIYLKDIIKGGIKERFAALRKMGIRTLMITGDNPLTAAFIAAEAGVDDYIAQATPEMKLSRIREEQALGHLVAMTGDGTNDAPALAQADVGVSMNTGTQPSREAGNMVDLSNNPTQLIDIVEIGKQLLMTRGALTTFSIANDVAKYFAIIPAIFGSLYATEAGKGPLTILNIMRLHSPKSSILSAVIFNALIIIVLIPLALKGVAYCSASASYLLRRNLMIYGVGGIILPFIGIKFIDLIITFFWQTI